MHHKVTSSRLSWLVVHPRLQASCLRAQDRFFFHSAPEFSPACGRRHRQARTRRREHAHATSGKLPESPGAELKKKCALARETPCGRDWFFFLFLQCLIFFESEKNFSLKAVLGFELEKHCQGLAILRNKWESPSFLYSIWKLSELDF